MDGEHPRSFTAWTTIAELVQRYPSSAQVFIRRRMHCVGCEIDRFHTVDDACRVYGLPLRSFLSELHRSR
jgi:hybrid cluster-associated redox disulfide protein